MKLRGMRVWPHVVPKRLVEGVRGNGVNQRATAILGFSFWGV